jgi:hypothetical protein
MSIANKNDSNKADVRAKLEVLRAALRDERPSALTNQGLEQCDRLWIAIAQFHAEGLRFAAFTLLRLTEAPGTAFSESVREAATGLKRALDSAGYPH